MAEQLFIRLPSKYTERVQWLVWATAEQEIIASGELNGAQQLHELTDKAKQRKVVVLVDSSSVVLKQLSVPAKSTKAMQMAVPYMLEDDMAQDVEALFFAYGNVVEGDNNCAVAVLEKRQMQDWLVWLADAQIVADILVPEVLALPPAQESWQAIAISEQFVVRQGSWQGTTIDLSLLALLMDKWRGDNDGESLRLSHYSAIPDNSVIADIEFIAQPEELPLALMAQHIDLKAFNLLQGEFKQKKEQLPWVKTWSWAAGLAITAILLNVLFKGIHLFQLNQQIVGTESAIVDAYKKAFPQTKRVRVNTIRSQINRKLASIGGQTTDIHFLTMIEQMQPAFSQVASLKPDSIKYDAKRKELRMQASAKDYQDFERFQAALKKGPFVVSQGALNNQGTSVSGSISIKYSNGGRS